MGPSGSGKSTFLNVAAGLDRPTQGSVWLGDIDIGAFNLLPSLTVSQNISLPVHLGKGRLDRAWLDEVVARTGLGARLRHRPSELSGGQQQRVALARALVTRPDVLFADEPTGALDTKTSGEVLRLIREIADRTGQTVVMVTHDPTAAAYADRVVFLADGRLAGALEDPSADAVAERLTRLGDWAVSNMRTASRRFASAMTPIVLTVAISSTLLFSGTTREHATAEQSRHRVSADLVIQSDGVGIPRSALDDARRVEDVAPRSASPRPAWDRASGPTTCRPRPSSWIPSASIVCSTSTCATAPSRPCATTRSP